MTPTKHDKSSVCGIHGFAGHGRPRVDQPRETDLFRSRPLIAVPSRPAMPAARRTPLRAALALALVAALSMLFSSLLSCAPVTRHAHATSTRPQMMGVTVSGAKIIYKTRAAMDADLDRITWTGGRWIRVDVVWKEIEHTRGTLQWSAMDRFVADARARGLRICA